MSLPRRRSGRFSLLARWLTVSTGVVALGVISCSSDSGRPAAVCNADATGVTATQNASTSNGTVTESSRVSGEGDLDVDKLVTVHGRMYLHALIHTDHTGGTRISVDYGPDIQGVRHVDFATSDGKTGTLTIDARGTQPFELHDPTYLQMLDGGRVPSAVVDPDIQKSANDLLSASHAEPQCNQTGLGAQSTHILDGIPGQHQSPQTSDNCNVCNVACLIVDHTCLGVVAGGCAAFFAVPIIGPALYAACVGTGVILCSIALVACHNACESGSACCPTHCGPDFCCDTGNACLNPTDGTCCTSDHPKACGGTVCCLQTDDCLADAPQGPTCCPEGPRSCGSQCCPSGEKCTGGSTCCPTTSPTACAGKCCGPDQTLCLNGECCSPDKQCGAICCTGASQCQTGPNGPVCACDAPNIPCGAECCERFIQQCAPGNPAAGIPAGCCPGNAFVCNGECCPSGCGPDGNCCPASQACGTLCCGAGQVCASAFPTPTCCPNDVSICSGQCCDNASPCGPSPSGPVCCGQNGTIPCGSQCCNPGQVCSAAGGLHCEN